MKRLVSFSIILLLSQTIYAQREYDFFNPENYTSDTLRMDGYAYVCDTLLGKNICIYNIDNHPGRGVECYKDGTPIKVESWDELFDPGIDKYVLTSRLQNKLFNLVDWSFSKEQAKTVSLDKLEIVLYISSTDGTITDVYFWYWHDSPYAEIPLGVFRQIELSLKNEVTFELTEEGRKMNFCSLSWIQVPKGRIEIEPTPNDSSEGGGGSTGAGNTIIEGPVRNNTDIITMAGGR